MYAIMLITHIQRKEIIMESFTNFMINKWIKYDKYKGAAQICAIILNGLILIFKLLFCGIILLITAPHIAANKLISKGITTVTQKILYVLLVIISLIFDIPLMLICLIGVYGFFSFLKEIFSGFHMVLVTIIFGAIAYFSGKYLLLLIVSLFSKSIPESMEEKLQTENIEDEHLISADFKDKILLNETSIDDMNGIEFERFCAALLRLSGYKDVCITSSSGDQGVDIIAEKDCKKWAFQCKHYAQPVGNFAAREVYAGMAFYHCDKGAVMTNNTFTRKAKEFAEETGIFLWERSKLLDRVSATHINKEEMDVYRSNEEWVCMEENDMTIDQKMVCAVNEILNQFGVGNRIVTTEELYVLLNEKYGVTKGSVIPSDYCYNRVNDGIDPNKKPMLFKYVDRGQYLCLGENCPYNGKIYHKDQVVGICKDGVRILYR